MVIAPPDAQRVALCSQYRSLIQKAGEARLRHGQASAEYAATQIALTVMVETVYAAYGFRTNKDAHHWLRTQG